MEKSAILKQIQTIKKQGFLQKQSRFLKSWRQRWVVITNNLLLTFKQRRVYQSHTQLIMLKQIISIKSCEDDENNKNSFKVETNQTTFFFMAESANERQNWIGAIGKAMVKSNNADMDD